MRVGSCGSGRGGVGSYEMMLLSGGCVLAVDILLLSIYFAYLEEIL